MTRVLLFDARAIEGGVSGVRDVAIGLLGGLRTQAEQTGDFELIAVGANPSLRVADVLIPERGFLQFHLPRLAVQTRADCVFIPRQTTIMAPGIRVGTLFHDVGFLELPNMYRTSWKMRLSTRAAGLRSRALGVSRFTVASLRKHHVIGHGTALPLGAMHRLTWNPGGRTRAPYILYVAALQPHKNIERLIDAWDLARTAGYELVLCGRTGAARAAVLGRLSRSAKRHAIHLIDDLEDEDYFELLSEAHGYIQPSFHEGLGIPALDAAAMGCPIACADVAHLGSALAGAPDGVLFDPWNISAMVSSLEALIWSDQFRRMSSTFAQSRIRVTDWSDASRGVVNALL